MDDTPGRRERTKTPERRHRHGQCAAKTGQDAQPSPQRSRSWKKFEDTPVSAVVTGHPELSVIWEASETDLP
jgi:hypothetical protein